MSSFHEPPPDTVASLFEERVRFGRVHKAKVWYDLDKFKKNVSILAGREATIDE